jgi:hypothetical protein
MSGDDRLVLGLLVGAACATLAAVVVAPAMFILFVLVFPKGLLGLGATRRRREIELAAETSDVAAAPAYEAALAKGRRP